MRLILGFAHTLFEYFFDSLGAMIIFQDEQGLRYLNKLVTV
jgi:hypothetical protein